MTSSRILSICAALALSITAGCSGCGPSTEDPAPETCSDGTKNGVETGVDCGGAVCVAEGKTCGDSSTCAVGADCTSSYCNPDLVCSTPSCTDTWTNGTETDLNCGGSCSPCADTKVCAVAADCTSGYCDATYHCAQPCGALGATCATGGDCCLGLCDDTNHCVDQLCTANGQACGSPTECCTGICDVTCQPPPSCTLKVNGDLCAAGTECCSGYCGSGGLCADPCAVNGATCATGAVCCSSNCDATNHCAPACQENGTSCGSDTECCTGICTGTPKACAPAPTCTLDNQPCPAAPGSCCSGVCDGTNCVAPCTGDGGTCDFGSDCCSTYCNPSKICERAPSCRANSVACLTDSQCCLGWCRPDTHVCDTPVSTCQDPSAICTVNADCCSGACDNPTGTPNAGVCPTDAFCGVPGAACVYPSDCCFGTCSGGICTDTACLATGDSCSAGTDCCSGLCSTTNPRTCEPLTDASSCKILGDSCSLDVDCCSTNCVGGRCQPAYECHAPNDVCYVDSDCCSGMCDAVAPAAGRCILPSGGCNQDGAPCTNASNCCTRLCVDMGAGVTVCKPASGCRMTGDYCDRTQACCGGSPDALRPDGYRIFCDTAGTSPAPDYDPSNTDDYRCGGGTACNPPGNICGAAGDPASQNCCDGKKAVCKRDSQGIARCFGGCPNDDCGLCPDGYGMQYDPPCCIGTDAGTSGRDNICQFRDQCCNGYPCTADANGDLRCTAPTCTPEHGACSGADDSSCCVGFNCEFNGTSFSCEAGTCANDGASCQVASDCCSNNCVAGVCEPPCVRLNGACTFDECCSGLVCDRAPGASSGTCQNVSQCADTGASCSLTLPCCNSAEACLDGVCALPPQCKDQFAGCTAADVPPAVCCTGLTCMEENGTACSTTSTACSCDDCSPDGGTCDPSAASTGCCLGLTCNGTGTTGTCSGCALLGNDCTTTGSNPCCETLFCSNASGTVTGCDVLGACTCNSCVPLAQDCSFGGAACCGGGSNYCELTYTDPDGTWTRECASGDTGCVCAPTPG